MIRNVIFLIIVLVIKLSAQPIINSVTSNKDTLGLYDKFELTLDLISNFKNAFDENQILITARFVSPSAKAYTVRGFYYQDFIRSGPPESLAINGSPVWKIRFTPNEIGEWTYTISCKDSGGTRDVPMRYFLTTNSDNKGFIRVANNKYLKFENGESFFPVGENIPFYDSIKKTYEYEEFINKLSAKGGNFIRVWMSSASFAIEWKGTPLGDYLWRLNRAYQLDWLLDYCKQKNIYVQICIYSHGQFSTAINPEWDYNPYNVALGGPLEFPYEFFSDTTSIKFSKNKIKYILARWGYSPTIMAFELFNEVDNVDSFYNVKNSVNNWLLNMAQFVKENDINKHLLSTSYYNEFLDDAVFTSPNIDFTQTHHYNTTSDVQTLHYFYSQMKVNDYYKPSIIGEFDFHDLGNWAALNDQNGIDFHNSLWANSFSGAFGTPLTWSWNNFIDNRDLYYHFYGISKFTSQIDFANGNFTPILPQITTQSRANYSVSPAFTKYAKAPQNIFEVYEDGFVSPSALYLGKYLFGTVANPQFRNPPTFYANYDIPGEFKVICGSDSAIAPRIQIKVNGDIKLDQPANINATYSVSISNGFNRITVDNSGFDWIKIDEYVITNFVKTLRSYALKSDSAIYGWIHNRNYNWRYLRDYQSEPVTIKGATINFSGLVNSGYYKIQWYDCINLNILKTEYVLSENQSVQFNVPPVLWDLAYKITSTGTSFAENEVNNINSYSLSQNYPNPFNPSTTIQYEIPTSTSIPQAQDGISVSLKIYDILGRVVETLVNKEQTPGKYAIEWNAEKYSSGIYYYELNVGNGLQKFRAIKKMILLK